jgi:hypothetical protein
MRSLLLQLEQSRLLVTCLLVTFFALLFLYIDHTPLWHTDVWAHMKLGAYIVEYRKIPEAEPFNPFTEDKRMIPSAWLSQVILWKVYTAGAWLPFRWAWDESANPCGVIVLKTFHALLLMARFLFLFWAFQRWGGSRLVAFLGILVCFGLSWHHLAVLRPQVFGELCLAIMLFLVSRKPPTKLAVWLVPIVMCLWTNLHGSYLNGLLILLGILVARLLVAIRKSSGGEEVTIYSPVVRRTFRMFYLSILVIGLFNPYGHFRWYLDTLSFASNANVRMMDEWQRLDWSSFPGQLFLGSLVLVVLTQLIAKAKHVAGISLGQGLLLLCFGIQTVFFVRMLPWWAILCPFVCVGPWSRIMNLVDLQGLRQSLFRVISELAVVMAGFWTVFSFSTLFQTMYHEETPTLGKVLHPGTPRLIDVHSKRKLAKKIDQQIHDVMHRPNSAIFASETLGDYLYFSGNIPVVIFTHVQLFSEEHWRKCLMVKEGSENWEKYLNEWNVQVIIVEPELHPHLVAKIKQSPNWEVKLDETTSGTKPNPKSRHFIALRK